MKAILTLTLLFVSLNLIFGQTVKYSDIEHAEKRLKGKFQTYISKSGDSYSVEDTVEIGKPTGSDGKYLYIYVTNPVVGIVEMGGDFLGLKLVIKTIKIVGKKGNIRAHIYAKGGNKLNDFYFYLEQALDGNEIIGKGLSSNAALDKLKQAKTKLDLQLISQEEYDKIKIELSKYIK